jgi:hypothetical protein
MWKIILKVIAFVFLVIFQLAIVTKLSIGGAIPNFLLIIAISLIFRGQSDNGLLLGGISGLLLDLVSPLRFGAYTLFFMIVLLIINFYILKIFPVPSLGISFLIFVASLLLVDLGLFLFMGHWPFWQIFPQAIINGIWGVLIYWILKKVIPVREEIRIGQSS